MKAKRKPIHKEAKGKKSYGRQAMWDYMREHERFRLKEVALFAKRHPNTVREYVQRLIAGGYLEEDGFISEEILGRKHKSKAYRRIKKMGHIAVRLDKKGNRIIESRDYMWKSMPILKVFTARDLALNATVGTVTVQESDAADYCRHLCRAGYLQIVKEHDPRGGKTVYRFIKHTGYHAPMVQRAKTVFDPNLCKVMYHEELDP